MRLLRYVVRRLLFLVPVLLGVVFIAFALTRMLPGDPIAMIAGPYVGEERRAEMRREARLDRPFYEQFGLYLVDLAQGNMGTSYNTARPVHRDLLDRFPATAEMVVLSMALAVIIAIPLGVAAAVKRDSLLDHFLRVLVVANISVPTFWLALVLLQIFFFKLDWVPGPTGRLPIIFSPPPRVTGMFTVDALIAGDMEVFKAAAMQLVMPVVVLGAALSAPIMRMTRASLLEALESDYIRCARALGLPGVKVVYQHALKNALIPVLTLVAAVFGFALGGSVLMEIIFAWPGMGSYAYEAITNADFPALQGFIMLVTVIYVLVYLVLDILIAAVDPRVEL